MKWEVSLFGLHDHGETKSISFSTSILIGIVEGHCRLLWVCPKFPPFAFQLGLPSSMSCLMSHRLSSKVVALVIIILNLNI